jgi:hypothetical protein
LFETLTNVTGKMSLVPFDNWSLLPFLYPWYLGVTTGAATYGATGLLAVGTNPHDPGNTGSMNYAGAWASDGTEYNFNRVAIIKPPDMTFAPGEKLFGSFDMAAIGALVLGGASTAALPTNQGFLMSAVAGTVAGDPITESAPSSGAIGSGTATDPDTTGFTTTDFAQTYWLAQWGNVVGWQNFESENGFVLSSECKFNEYKVQGITRLYKLASCRFAIKCKPVGPSHSSLLQLILGAGGTGGYQSGAIIKQANASTLTLTGSNLRTVALSNCSIKNAPFSFGGTNLRAGEIMFVTDVLVNSSQKNTGSAVGAVPSLTFSL